MRALLLVAWIALFATGARAAVDCLAPLEEHGKWSCEGQLSNGQPVEFCMEYTHAFGAEPKERYYKTSSTGMYRAHCSCLAKGRKAGLGFGEDPGYVCLDRETDTVIRGKATKTKLAGETFNVTSNVRSSFSCRPDPGCDVPPVVDPDLAGEFGFLKLPAGVPAKYPIEGAGGAIDVGYLGCEGYTSEAPLFVFELDSPVPRTLRGLFAPGFLQDDARGVLVMGPSGAARCAPVDMEAEVTVSHGRVGLWVLTNRPEARVKGEIRATHDE